MNPPPPLGSFEGHSEPSAIAHFYQVPTFESVGGRELAELIAENHLAVPGFTPAVSGMRLPVLRETRMPAVLVTLGPIRHATDATALLTGAVMSALETWTLRKG